MTRLFAFLLVLLPLPAVAAGLPAVTVDAGADGAQTYSLSLQVLIAMTAITLLPAILLSMTAFPRIVIVLGLLRSALGTGQTPSNQILVGLALMLSFFVMGPVLERVYADAMQPYLDDEIDMPTALQAAAVPLREFMLAQTRESSLIGFSELDGNTQGYADPADIPFRVLVPAFVTSELTTAFQIGFVIFLPFLLIYLISASVLMAMGMIMVPPLTISLPIKVLMFVLIEGWSLVTKSLVGSFA